MYPRARYLEPTDKKTWEQLKHPIATVKLDGANYFIQIDAQGKPHYISRRMGVKGNFPERTESLPHLDFTLPEYSGHVLNVELLHSGFSKDNIESHSVLSGILNSLPPKAIETQKVIGPVRLAVHNIINPNFNTYAEKLEYMQKFVRAVNKPDLVFVPQIHKGKVDIQALIRHTQKRGQEGVIITDLHLPENVNVRFKQKNKIMHNLLVSGFQQAIDKDGKPKEEMGALIVKDATGKVVGKVGTGFSRNDRIEAFKHPERWLGRVIQVESLGWAVNALRMPVYGGDADGDVDTVV